MFRPLLISTLLTSATLADTWTVDDDGKADFNNIQAAVDAASDGDEIVVMPGTYTNISFYGQGGGITVRSKAGPSMTIIDAQGSGNCVYIRDVQNVTIDGFTMTGGYAFRGGGAYLFDSVYSTLQNCIITGNTAEDFQSGYAKGGGVYCGNCKSDFVNLRVTDNHVAGAHDSLGGGFYFSGAGGAFFCASIADTVICGNTADQIYNHYNNCNWTDGGGNIISDECPICPDVNSDGIIDPNDIMGIIWAWGTCDTCSEDLNEDGVVNLNDLMIVIDSWGMACE